MNAIAEMQAESSGRIVNAVAPLLSKHPPTDKPVLIWDEDCKFCRRSIKWLCQRVGHAVSYVPYQRAGGRFPDIEAGFPEAVHLIEEDGRVRTGAEAILRALFLGGHTVPWKLRKVPGAAPLSELVYRWVANHRPFLSRITAPSDSSR